MIKFHAEINSNEYRIEFLTDNIDNYLRILAAISELSIKEDQTEIETLKQILKKNGVEEHNDNKI